MPINPVMRALGDAWKTLEALQAPMAVMGGLALAVWEHVRATQDVDLLIALGDSDVDRVVQRMGEAGFHPKRTPPVMKLQDVQLIQFQYEPPGTYLDVQVDLLLADSEYHRLALSRRVATRLPDLDVEVCVLTCEDLILHKLLADRILDRADCVALLIANRKGLDCAYLDQWSNRLGLGAAFSDVWQSAFPKKVPPPV